MSCLSKFSRSLETHKLSSVTEKVTKPKSLKKRKNLWEEINKIYHKKYKYKYLQAKASSIWVTFAKWAVFGTPKQRIPWACLHSWIGNNQESYWFMKIWNQVYFVLENVRADKSDTSHF